MAVHLRSYFFILLIFTLLPDDSVAAFGEAIEDKVTDFRFKNMGQAYVSEFEIVDTKAKFEVILEVSKFQVLLQKQSPCSIGCLHASCTSPSIISE